MNRKKSLRLPPNVLVCSYKVFVFSNTLANKRVWVYFLVYLKKLLMLFIILIITIIIKQSDKKKKKKQNARTKPIRSFPKIPISDYVVQFCPWLKQYSVLLPFFGVMS